MIVVMQCRNRSPMEQMMANMTDEERAAAMAQMGGDGHSHGGASSGARRAAAGTPARGNVRQHMRVTICCYRMIHHSNGDNDGVYNK
jgi:ABC-type microcin C transport system permease subunit YejB